MTQGSTLAGSSDKPNIVVLISGSGSNLQAFIDAIDKGELNANISAVISNRAGVFGLERAQKANIPTQVIDHKAFDSRESFDKKLASVIDEHQPNLVILAGFMRILTSEFVNHYLGKMMNIHPSLLPKYTGLNTHQRAIDAGDDKHGVTVHFVTAELDGGPAIIQAEVPILVDDSAETLAKRVQVQEHKIYPLATKWFIEQRLTMENGGSVLDGKTLPKHGHLIQHG